MNKAVAAILMAASVSACQGGYAGGDYMPVVDVQQSEAYKTTGGNDAATRAAFLRDWETCDAQKDQRSIWTAEGTHGLLPTLGGAAVGAGIGALAGNSSATTILSGVGGAATGALYSAGGGNAGLQDITIGCMRDRGWKVRSR